MGIGQWIDVGQTGVMGVMVAALLVVMLLLRGELRRSAGVMNAMMQAIGEQSDLRRRLEQVEDDVAQLVMDVDRLKKNNNNHYS